MKILGVDTSTKFLALGIYDGKNTSEYNLNLGRAHSSLLVPMIQRVLSTLGWSFNDLDYLACGIGPGSFTGIRVGLSAMKGLSWAAQKPLIGIPTLDILAYAVEAGREDALIVPIIDAKRNLVYSCTYKNSKKGLKRSSPYMLLALEELLGKLSRGRIILCGDALDILKEKIVRMTANPTILERDYWYPKGHVIVELAREIIQARRSKSSGEVKPIYLYPKDCQIRVKSG